MLLNVVRVVYALVCAGAIVALIYPDVAPGIVNSRPGASEQAPDEDSSVPQVVRAHPYLSAIVLMLITQSVTVIDLLIRNKRIESISAIYFGVLIGVLLSYVLIQVLNLLIREEVPYRDIVVVLITLILPYVCISFLLQTKDDFRFIIPYIEFARELKGGRPLVLDTSALIDGRVADLAETHIIDSQLVVPQFVLQEVQDIADSRDKNRRSRGRRGLEMLSKLRNNPDVDVKMHDSRKSDFNGVPVDQCLVALAKQLSGRIITNDINLNKVAAVQGIEVVNLNDVANSLKPRYLPGERLKVKVLKEGESAGQGVGYLDDGTMVVCEQAVHRIGKEIDVVVTSMLQSSGGRMIFGREVRGSDAH